MHSAYGIFATAPDWSLAQLTRAVSDFVVALLSEGYDRAPVPVLVLSAILIVPMAAVLSYAIGVMLYRFAERRPDQATNDAHATAVQSEDAAWPSQAWLDIDGQVRSALPTRAALVRIGRHEDNEIFIPDTSVHRHHAIIQRTVEADYVITDISGKSGNGVLINGEKFQEARLFDGDVIELGAAKMRFSSALL